MDLETCLKLLPKIEMAIQDNPTPQTFNDFMLIVPSLDAEQGLYLTESYKPRLRELMADSAEHRDFNKAEEYRNALFNLLAYRAHYKFADYLEAVEFNRAKRDRFFAPRQYLGKLVEAYQSVYDGDLKLLTVSMPKRAGKSQMGINYVNWISGIHPDRSSLMEGTGEALVTSFYQGCLEYLQTPNDYEYYHIFPSSKLCNTNAKLMTFDLNKVKRFSTVMCRSVDASQVGLSEATNVLYLDDCVSGREEAMNRGLLDKKWISISGDVIGRAIEGTPIIMAGTRYSLYDPIGRMQEFARQSNWKWKSIELPALDENDESTCAYYNPKLERMVFTTDYFREQRKLVTQEAWESEFQQQPFEAKGLMFPREELMYFNETPMDEPDSVVAYIDPAGTGTDSTCMWVCSIYGDRLLLTDVVFDNSPASVTEIRCADAIMRNKVTDVCCESNNGGDLYANDVSRICAENGYKIFIRTKRTNGNKQAKIEHNSPAIKANFYFRAWETLKPNTDYWNALREVTTYTRSGKVPHDDAPDCLAMLNMDTLTVGKATCVPFARPF